MYVAIQILLFAIGVALTIHGFRQGRAWRAATGIAILALTILFFALLGFWGRMLWFEAIGYEARFWTVVAARAGTLLGGALIALAGVFLLTRFIPAEQHGARKWALAAGAIIGGAWGYQTWSKVLVFLNRVSADMSEPILKLDAGFYMFVLPLLDRVHGLLFWTVLVAIVAVVLSRLRWQTAPDGTGSVALTRPQQGQGGVPRGPSLPAA